MNILCLVMSKIIPLTLLYTKTAILTIMCLVMTVDSKFSMIITTYPTTTLPTTICLRKNPIMLMIMVNTITVLPTMENLMVDPENPPMMCSTTTVLPTNTAHPYIILSFYQCVNPTFFTWSSLMLFQWVKLLSLNPGFILIHWMQLRTFMWPPPCCALCFV